MERNNSTDPSIRKVSQLLWDGIREPWDADARMDNDYVFQLPPGKFVTAVFDSDPEVLSWLVFFVARRALPCWEISCEDDRLRTRVRELGRHLAFGQAVDWAQLEVPVDSPFDDCRYSDTQSASNSVAAAARYINRKDLIQAVYCIASANVAYAHVLTHDRFREWLISMAVPAAFEKREMPLADIESLRQDIVVKPEQVGRPNSE